MEPIKNQSGKRMWPFLDMSLSTATWWSDVANLVFLGSLLFGVLSTFAIVRLTNVKEHHWDIARDQSRERVAGLEAELGQAHAAIADANARALEAKAALEKFKSPRTLSPEQIARIIETLNPFSGQEYTLSAASGSEPENLLCILDNILVTAGWKRHSPFGPISVGTRCGSVALNTLSGVHARVSISADAELEQRAIILASALNNEGIISQPAKDPENIPIATIINLMVGAKP